MHGCNFWDNWWFMIIYITIVLLCRYANHVCISYTTRTNYGNESNLPLTIHTPSIFGNTFLRRGTYRISMLSWFRICMCMNKMNFGNHLIQRMLKTKSSLKSNWFENCILLVLPNSIGCNFSVENWNPEFYPSLERLQNALWFLHSRFSQSSSENRLKLQICPGILFCPEMIFSRTPQLAEIITPETLTLWSCVYNNGSLVATVQISNPIQTDQPSRVEVDNRKT
jgi:hypothetical protein